MFLSFGKFAVARFFVCILEPEVSIPNRANLAKCRLWAPLSVSPHPWSEGWLPVMATLGFGGTFGRIIGLLVRAA
jgi:hypothetical protein